MSPSSGARRLKSRCGQGHAPPEGARAGSFPASSSLMWLLVTLRSVDCRHTSATSVITWHFSPRVSSLLIRTPIRLDLGNPNDFFLT